METTPTVSARRIRTRPDNDLLLVTCCPYCGSAHVHGACGKDSPLGAGDGLVLAHCGRDEYDVREVARRRAA